MSALNVSALYVLLYTFIFSEFMYYCIRTLVSWPLSISLIKAYQLSLIQAQSVALFFNHCLWIYTPILGSFNTRFIVVYDQKKIRMVKNVATKGFLF